MADTGNAFHRLAGLDAQRPLGLVTRKKRTLSLSSQAMIDLLRERRDSAAAD